MHDCESVFWSIVVRSINLTIFYFADEDLEQAHFLCRWRQRQTSTSLPRSSIRTMIYCVKFIRTMMISKQFSRLPVSFSPFSAATVLSEVLYNPPRDRDRIGRVGGI